MSDTTETVASLREAVRQFVNERDWSQFHTPKNLSMSIAIEAAELMEHFQWVDAGATGEGDKDAAQPSAEAMQEIREELADILCYALSFANALDIDVSEAVREKLVKNARKYPAEAFRGRFR